MTDVAAFVGIDLAWSPRNLTGLAVVDGSGALVASASARTDDDIDSWLTVYAPEPRVVAVDAPLIVPNATGQRECERLIGKAYGRYDASCYPANRGTPWMNPPRGETLAGRHGWSVDPEAPAPVCIEVYPHAAMVGMFGLGRTLKYKKGAVEERRIAMLEVLRLLETLTALSLDSNARWRQIRRHVSAATRPVDLNRIEDEVDAILCAHLSWRWAITRDGLQVYGDAQRGYIVAPPPPAHPAAPRQPVVARESPSGDLSTVGAEGPQGPQDPRRVSFRVNEIPAPFATAREETWRAAVATAALAALDGQACVEGRVGVELDFVMPRRGGRHPGWDLDNLIKPTIDALGAVIGARAGHWRTEQTDDERVDEIHACKREVRDGEEPHASIRVWALRRGDAPVGAEERGPRTEDRGPRE